MPRFYFTTPIYYVSDVPHLGHAYTTIVADTLARYHRLRGDDTRYLTGTDDHGQKIERMAAARNKDPKSYADEIAAKYRETWATLGISNDDFIRTTDEDHESVVKELWQIWEKNGDIYLGHYEGWYCVPCEQYYTEKELSPGNICPVHHKPVEKLKEETFFFRLSAYQKKLQDFYDRVARERGRPFIEPQMRMNEVRAFVDGGLNDFSASRTNFTWGVPLPGHAGHVAYVWVDALTNYYSATRRAKFNGFWKASADDDREVIHLMGKEITRFHAVYWPAMLMAAGIEPPSKIIAHGWWTVDGEKMSKTQGNVVDPNRLAADIGADAFRYFVLREVPLGADGDFSHEALITRYNSELANDLGNLLNRTLGMVWKYFPEGLITRDQNVPRSEAPEHRFSALLGSNLLKPLDDFAPSRALEEIWKLVREANTYVDQTAPWKQSKERQNQILWHVLEACRVLGHLVSPFMPERAKELHRQLGVVEEWGVPVWGGWEEFRVMKGEPLFPRIDEDRKKQLLAGWMPVAVGATSPSPSPSTSTTTSTSTSTTTSTIEYADFAKLDLRVGEISAAERVPKKDKLLKLTVDLGTEKRQVVAGIAGSYKPEEIVGKRVIFVANLKPAKIGGVMSEGMILAAGEGDALALSALDRVCAPGTKVK